MTHNARTLIIGLVLASLVLSACSLVAPAAPAATPTAAVTQKICQVTGTNGVDDKSFNQNAYEGVKLAQTQFGWGQAVLISQQQTDYEKNINEFLEAKCDLILTVGFLLGEATGAAAKAHPEQKFEILDYAYDPVIPNVWAQVYSTDQAAFLAGYVAASVTKTGKVGVFGGLNISTVTDYMDGFLLGVKYHNEKNGTDVEMLGWDPANRDDPEVSYFTGNFTSADDGRAMAEKLMDEGADIIMPVAGPVGLGTAAAVADHGQAYIIGVDTDWTVFAPEYKNVTLTSVLKRLDLTVVEAVKAVNDGSFTGGTHVANLANNGVGLAEFHDLDYLVTVKTKAALEQIKAGIIAGTIKTKP
jgi:basic membrane protein A